MSRAAGPRGGITPSPAGRLTRGAIPGNGCELFALSGSVLDAGSRGSQGSSRGGILGGNEQGLLWFPCGLIHLSMRGERGTHIMTRETAAG